MIGYYIHHHGRGHLTRASSIATQLTQDVTALTSMPLPSDAPFTDVVHLPRDDDSTDPINPTAAGRFHWVPQHDRGLQTRMHAIADWIIRCRPDAIVVDVSVEVTTLAKLFGVPVVVLAMPGERTDPPHDLVYALADHIVAPWPGDLYAPAHLAPHVHKTTFVGGISRFDGRPVPASFVDDTPLALVLSGAGGSNLTADEVAGWARQNPDYRWQAIGVAGTPWIDDPWPLLCEASVVISGAGQNSVADIAAAQRPAVIVPQTRPFDEQAATATVLERNGLAVTSTTWPAHHEWSGLLRGARRSNPRHWNRWQTRGAAQRAARAIDDAADRTRIVESVP